MTDTTFARRSLNLFAGFLNCISVISILFIALFLLEIFTKLLDRVDATSFWFFAEYGAKIGIYAFALLVVASLNYLVFSNFGVWCRMRVLKVSPPPLSQKGTAKGDGGN